MKSLPIILSPSRDLVLFNLSPTIYCRVKVRLLDQVWGQTKILVSAQMGRVAGA